VARASVTVEGRVAGEIGAGLLVFVCAMRGDDDAAPGRLARRLARLRVFRDAEGRTNRSLLDVGGGALAVPQFTLAADTGRGNRPGFSAAAEPAEGERLFERFVAALRAEGVAVETGRFGSEMSVSLVNDGPMTIMLER
jgi:D-tyrosyl-tRNA(Tyr) deacylase